MMFGWALVVLAVIPAPGASLGVSRLPGRAYQQAEKERCGMAEMQVRWVKGLQARAFSRDHELIMDAPKDSGGFDEGFTPGETFIASIGG